MYDGGSVWRDNGLQAALWQAFANAQDPADPLAAIGELMVGSTQFTFEMQGRPETWQPLSLATLIGRAGGTSNAFYARSHRARDYSVGNLRRPALKRMMSARILIDTSVLLHSIDWEVSGAGVAWGSNLVYAAIQNFGGQAGRNHAVTIPARQFIHGAFDFETDRDAIEQILREWALAPLAGGGA